MDWGWRIPFAFGVVLFPVGLYLRSRVVETPVFERLAEEEVAREPPFSLMIRSYKSVLLLGFGISAICIVVSQTFNSCMPAYVAGHLSVPGSRVFLSVMLASVAYSSVVPLSGFLSDRLGRRSVMMTGAVASLILPPLGLLYLEAAPSMSSLLVLLVSANICLATYCGTMCATLCEIFPTRIRLSGLSTSYSLAVTIFGGLTPPLNLYLAQQMHSAMAVMLGMGLSAVLSIICLLFIEDRHDVALH